MRRIFMDVYNVKRLQPGQGAGRASARASFGHDCSTLGGNSGSPIFSMKTGRVVGLHRDGYFLYRNEAVDGASLDEFIRPRL
jgi:hypothetical protein